MITKGDKRQPLSSRGRALRAEDDDMDDIKDEKKETGGANIMLNVQERQRKKTIVEKKVLEYNNKDPQSVLEEFMMPKERVIKKNADNPESDDLEFKLDTIDSDIMKKIENADFKKYCDENIHDRSYWGKKQTVDQILSYSKSLSHPILNLPKEVESMMLKNFKSKMILKM